MSIIMWWLQKCIPVYTFAVAAKPSSEQSFFMVIYLQLVNTIAPSNQSKIVETGGLEQNLTIFHFQNSYNSPQN